MQPPRSHRRVQLGDQLGAARLTFRADPLGEQVGVPVYSEPGGHPPTICENALFEAKKTGRDTVILDTAGRLHIDEELMAELKEVHRRTVPQETFLVCDAMTGQDAVNSADEFNKQIEISGVILTKVGKIFDKLFVSASQGGVARPPAQAERYGWISIASR